MPTLADIVREHGGAYLERFGPSMLPSHRRALRDLGACRTPALGGHVQECGACGFRQYVYHSCRNRACPSCHARRTEQWLEDRRTELLPVRYHHVVFTLPAELRDPARRRQTIVLGCMMKAAAASLSQLAADPRYVGGRIGVLSVLHTSTRALVWHPHVHCLVPGIGVAGDRETVRPSDRFLLPVQALSVLFRAKLVALLRRALPELRVPGAVWRKDWVVYSRPCPEGGENVLQYLARYAFRGPLSDRHILAVDNGRVTFRYTDNRTHRSRTVSLQTDEFLRRYLQHTLPAGFHRVRYYGLWSPANRTTLRLLRLLLPGERKAEAAALGQTRRPLRPRVCPRCRSPRGRRIGRLIPVPVPFPPATRGPPP